MGQRKAYSRSAEEARRAAVDIEVSAAREQRELDRRALGEALMAALDRGEDLLEAIIVAEEQARVLTARYEKAVADAEAAHAPAGHVRGPEEARRAEKARAIAAAESRRDMDRRALNDALMAAIHRGDDIREALNAAEEQGHALKARYEKALADAEAAAMTPPPRRGMFQRLPRRRR